LNQKDKKAQHLNEPTPLRQQVFPGAASKKAKGVTRKNRKRPVSESIRGISTLWLVRFCNESQDSPVIGNFIAHLSERREMKCVGKLLKYKYNWQLHTFGHGNVFHCRNQIPTQ
jgi:hypothetical protein